MSKLFHSEVTEEVILHKLFHINLPLIDKVEEHRCELRLELQEHIDSLAKLTLHEFLRWIGVCLKIVGQAEEERLEEGMAFEAEDILLGDAHATRRRHSDMVILSEPFQGISIEMEEECLKRLTVGTGMFLLAHFVVASKKCSVTFLKMNGATFLKHHVHLTAKNINQSMLYHHFLADFISVHMTEIKSIHVPSP